MDKDILETVLKKNWREAKLEKVLSIERTPAVGKYFNFTSRVSRLSLKVVLANGRLANKSLVIKETIQDNEKLAAFTGKYSIFKIETMMYSALTQMEYLMEEFEDTEDVLWCKMVHHIPYNCIVMEDLKAIGFHMMDRSNFFDLDHILLSVHSLGRYHGICKILESRGLTPQGLKTWHFFHEEGLHKRIYWEIVGLAEGVKRLWDPSWKPIVEKMKTTEAEVHEKLRKYSELDETKFNVMNHGDCHKNNIVFKYNWDNRPIAMRFVDFQLMHYGSPCIDLTYMLYLAVDPCVRRDNVDLILKTYHNALVNTLDKYHFDGNKPDIEEIREGMEKHYFMGLMLALSWYPKFLNMDKLTGLRDQEKIAATEGKEGFSDENFNPDLLERDIGPDIKAFVDRFCSN